MLTQLCIRDLAIVETLELCLDPGFAVLTGETGAGKSILLNALGLGLGGKADTGQIRPGAERAEVSLNFDVGDAPDAGQWLERNDLAESGECLIRRIITADGRSKAYVNGRPVTLSALQELGTGLIEIHGQHAHIHLLKPAEQRRLLDEAAGNGSLLQSAERLTQTYRNVQKELTGLLQAARDQSAREDLLRFQLDELEQHDIADTDYAALVEEHSLQANMGRILSLGQAQLDTLYEDERNALSTRLAHASHALAELAQLAPEFAECVTLLEEADVQVKEAASLLRRRLERLESDPARFDWLEQKLADLHRLARKHQIRPENLPEQLKILKTELDSLSHHAERIEGLQKEASSLLAEYAEVSAAITRRRTETARDLAQRISAKIQELGMPQGQFLVAVTPDDNKDPSPTGNDTITFLVSANPGLPPRPLNKVASGGELSRISLAIQVAATDSKTVPTLIFDEVDTGVGGRVAEIVGQKLRELGQNRQVLCVTHLPQVAAQGHYHLLVEKSSTDGMTQSTVHRLPAEERLQEIARMLGGVRITPQTLAHAAEMLNHERNTSESQESGPE